MFTADAVPAITTLIRWQEYKEDIMKQQYVKPEIITEVLLQEDVLKMSTDTDNSYVNSTNIFDDGFSVEDILI